VAERSAAVWMLEAVGTDSARRPDQFSAGSPSNLCPVGLGDR